MTLYDCTFILHPQIEESGLENYLKETKDLIGNYGGRVAAEKRIGMRRLAYEIQKLNQGYYISLIFEGNGRTVHELERHLRLDENCLRFLTCLASQKAIEAARSRREATPKAVEKPIETLPEEVPEDEDSYEESELI